MTLTTEDLQAIDTLLERRMSARATIPLPNKLNMEEFAWCVQRPIYSVRARRRNDRKFLALCEGKKRIKIHPSALALYGVDSGLAAARLAQFPGKLKAKSPGTESPVAA